MKKQSLCYIYQVAEKSGRKGALAMGYTLDIVLVAVCVAFVAIGAHRGFIRSAAHFLGAVVAASLAGLLGGAAAQWVFDTLFRPGLVERIGESLASLGSGDTYTAVQGVFASLPDFILRALEQAGVTAASVTEALAGQSGQAADLIADGLGPGVCGLSQRCWRSSCCSACLWLLVRVAGQPAGHGVPPAHPARRGRPAGRRVRPAAGGGFHLDRPGGGPGVHPHAGRRRPGPGGNGPAPVLPGRVWSVNWNPLGIMFQ